MNEKELIKKGKEIIDVYREFYASANKELRHSADRDKPFVDRMPSAIEDIKTLLTDVSFEDIESVRDYLDYATGGNRLMHSYIVTMLLAAQDVLRIERIAEDEGEAEMLKEVMKDIEVATYGLWSKGEDNKRYWISKYRDSLCLITADLIPEEMEKVITLLKEQKVWGKTAYSNLLPNEEDPRIARHARSIPKPRVNLRKA